MTRGVAAHSDGDVVLHALMDALLGAAGLGDIGQHFPDHDARYRDAASGGLLQDVLQKVHAQNLRVVNVDVTVVAQAPRLGRHREAMVRSMAQLLQLDENRVNLKATTHEGLGALGRGRGHRRTCRSAARGRRLTVSTPEFDAETCFGDGGQLAREVSGYHPREEQGAMAAAVWDALRRERTLAVEAGTGVGKTFAYLMPVLASGRKTLIATGTPPPAGPAVPKGSSGRAQVGPRPGEQPGLPAERPRQLPVPPSLPGLHGRGVSGAARMSRWRRFRRGADGTDTGDLAELD